MPCKDCSEPNIHGDYEPCCNRGHCDAAYTEEDISMCIHCGAEMFRENDCWFHHTQHDIPFEERGMIHYMEEKEN